MADLIDRQAAIDALDVLCQEHRYKIPGKIETYSQYNEAWQDALDRAEGAIFNLPSAQPERTCVNCGRTINNGGWYADGRTRCPIEEHYALPKDGYCHLWEKRNITDDDYPERREKMKIGDRIFVRGYIDEIRKDTVIVRNDGGYFGTVLSEVTGELPSAQPEQRWIPCSERLPEEDTEVLISYRYKEGEGDTDHVNIDITSYGTTCFGGREIHTLKEWRQPFDYFHANYEVIAWMPLPTPYREE